MLNLTSGSFNDDASGCGNAIGNGVILIMLLCDATDQSLALYFEVCGCCYVKFIVQLLLSS